MWGFHDGMGWWMVFGGFWSLAFLVAVVWLVGWTANRAGGPAQRSQTGEDALDIAKRRLARGEISAAEFDELKKALQ